MIVVRPQTTQERRQDRDDRHHDRHDREERGEHEGEHEQRAEAAEQRLDEHAGPVAAAALHRQRVEAGDVHGRTGDGRAGERSARVFGGFRVVFEGLLAVGRRVGDDERRALSLETNEPLLRARVAGQTRAGQRALQARFDGGEFVAHARRGDGLAGGQRDDGQQRRAVAAGAVEVAGDLLVGDPAFLAGHREFLLERFCRRAGGGHADERQHEPEDDDDALVCEDPACQRCHARSFVRFASPLGRRTERKLIVVAGDRTFQRSIFASG